MLHINDNTKEMIYTMFIWSRYKKNHFGNEEGTSVSKYTKTLVRLYRSDCQLKELGELEPQPEKQTKCLLPYKLSII